MSESSDSSEESVLNSKESLLRVCTSKGVNNLIDQRDQQHVEQRGDKCKAYNIKNLNIRSEPSQPSMSNQIFDTQTIPNGRWWYRRFVKVRLPFLRKKFIKFLRSEAMEHCGVDKCVLINQTIRIAPLQISTLTQDLELSDKIGHFHRRDELSAIFNKSRSGNIHYTELFDKARNLAAMQAPKNSQISLAVESHQRTHGNTVGVSGQAGIGKSTLAKNLLEKILLERLYDDIDYIFFLKFRDINYNQRVNLLEFLTNNPAVNDTYSIEEVKALLKLVNESDKVAIILDGLDEATLHETTKPFRGKCSIYNIEKAETFIKNLLTGSILPKSKRLLTSRPRQLLELHEDYKPKFNVNILGLDEKGQEQICKDICHNNEEQTPELFRFVSNRADLKSYCYVPVMCILVMYCIFTNLQVNTTINIDSITTILVATLELFVKNGHLHGAELQIRNLCHLAYTGFASNRLYFEKTDLDNSEISSKTATTFLTTTLAELKLMLLQGMVEKRTYFSHLMLQEFFVALHLLLFANKKLFKGALKDLTESKYEVVSKFLLGLCNPITLDYLKILLSSSEMIVPSKIQSREKLLKDFVSKQLEKQGQWDEDLADFLRLSAWAYELRDDEFSTLVSNRLNDEMTVNGNILPSDIPAFHHLLRARTSRFHFRELKVSVPNMDDLIQFYRELKHTLQQLPFVTVGKLYVTQCGKVGEVYDAVSQCLESVTELIVLDDEFVVDGDEIRVLSKALQQLSTSMHKLSLPNCRFTEEGLIALYPAISKIEEFEIAAQDSPISILGINPSAIKSGEDHKNGKLCVRKCRKEDDVFRVISRYLNYVSELVIQEDVPVSGMRILSENIQALHIPLKILNFPNCKFTDQGLIAILPALKNIEKFSIGDDSSPISIHGVGSRVDRNDTDYQNTKLVVQKWNKVDEVHTAFSECLNHVGQLTMRNVVPMSGISLLCCAIQKLSAPMQRVELPDTNMKDDELIAISFCLNNIEILDIGYIHLPPPIRGIEALAKAISKRSSPIKITLGCDNYSGKNEAEEILRGCGDKISELNLWKL